MPLEAGDPAYLWDMLDAARTIGLGRLPRSDGHRGASRETRGELIDARVARNVVL